MLGMGGELIVSLLSRAEWIKNKNIRLILQPMTHPEAVRAFLFESGFSIVDETLVEDDKIYQIIVAQFGDDYPTGYNSATKTELQFGKLNLCRGGELLGEYLLHWKEILTVRKNGKLGGSSDADVSEEAELLCEIERILERK
jgi:tRNA A22 N-methylase